MVLGSEISRSVHTTLQHSIVHFTWQNTIYDILNSTETKYEAKEVLHYSILFMLWHSINCTIQMLLVFHWWGTISGTGWINYFSIYFDNGSEDNALFTMQYYWQIITSNHEWGVVTWIRIIIGKLLTLRSNTDQIYVLFIPYNDDLPSGGALKEFFKQRTSFKTKDIFLPNRCSSHALLSLQTTEHVKYTINTSQQFTMGRFSELFVIKNCLS